MFPRDYEFLAAVLVIIWLLCALAVAPVRRSLLNGLHCLSCYPDLWRIPFIFTVAHGVYGVVAELVFLARVGSESSGFLDFHIGPVPGLSGVLSASWMPGLEAVVSNFTAFTTTVPLSAICALAFLMNWHGLLVEISRATVRRFPRFGILLVAFLVASSLAAIVFPFAILFLPELSGVLTFYGVQLIAVLGIFFDLLLGAYFLTYLMLMAYVWMRGMQFYRHKLLLVAARRTGFVLKWSLVLAAATLILVLAPQNIGILFLDASPELANFLGGFGMLTGPCIVFAFAFVFFPVQAILVFHNESLRAAMRESLRFLRRHVLVILPFVVAVLVIALAISSARTVVAAVLGSETIYGQSAAIIVQSIGAVFTGWFIASWVCLYKSRFSSRNEIPF